MLRMEFTQFAVYVSGTVDDCTGDHVKITDGDGTTLMDKSCGDSSSSPSSSDYFLPPILMTNTNAVKIFFRTDGSNTKSGWSLTWGAVTPGVLTSTGDHIWKKVFLPPGTCFLRRNFPNIEEDFS